MIFEKEPIPSKGRNGRLNNRPYFHHLERNFDERPTPPYGQDVNQSIKLA